MPVQAKILYHIKTGKYQHRCLMFEGFLEIGLLMKNLFYILPLLIILSGCCGSSCAAESREIRNERVLETAVKDANLPKERPSESLESAAVYVSAVKSESGPTVYLFAEGDSYPDNILSDFMYFVPLISPVAVTAKQSVENTQGGHLLSFKSDLKGDKFYVSCEFRMKGQGSFTNKFDDKSMIAWNTKKTSKKVFKSILDYIKFEGEGYGRIEAGGRISDDVAIADYVNVCFNARGADSPVSVGLYDVDLTKKEGEQYYQYNRKVARVNILSFERSKTAPLMGIKIAAVGESEEKLGKWAHFVGSIGNFFIDPIEIDRLGNDAMLSFGAGLYHKNSTFTFPIAKNLKQADN